MKIFVTGSAGMIGQNIVSAFTKAGHQLACYDLRPTPSEAPGLLQIEGDINDHSLLMQSMGDFEPECVVHLAAECGVSAPTRIEDYQTNTSGVKNMCEAARTIDSIKRTLFTSSQTVCKIGHQPAHDTDYCPESVYGQSKVLGEQIVRAEDGGGKEWVIVRPTTVWGPGIDLAYIEQHFIYQIYRGRYFHLGYRKHPKSYSYVENIAHQYLQLATMPAERVHRKTLYLADYMPLDLRTFTSELACCLGVRQPGTLPIPAARLLALGGDVLCKCGVSFPFHSTRMHNMLRPYEYDLSKTEEICGPVPYTMSQGVQRFSEWFLRELSRSGKVR